MAYDIGTELSYRVFELRRQRGELGTGVLDSSNQRLYPVPSAIVVREAYVADRPGVTDSNLPVSDQRSALDVNGPVLDLTLGHYRPRSRKG